MAQRPSIKQPKPLTSVPGDRLPDAASLNTAAQMLGEMKAEVSPEAAPLWNFVLEHARAIAAGVVALVLLIVGVAVWKGWQESASGSAKLELGRVLAIQDPARRLTALESFAADAPKAMRLAATVEIAAAAAEAGDWEKAAASYGAAADMDKGSPLAFAARLNQSDILMRLAKPAEALQILENLLAESAAKNSPANVESVRQVLNARIGEAAEAAGQPQRAVTAFEAVIASLPPASAEEPYYRARIATLQ